MFEKPINDLRLMDKMVRYEHPDESWNSALYLFATICNTILIINSNNRTQQNFLKHQQKKFSFKKYEPTGHLLTLSNADAAS